jgi:hypothetical protein
VSLRDQLQAIYEKHEQLTPAIVVNEARDKKHPLHDRFEWDDKVAGESWRREQAHQLIRSVKVVYKSATDDEPERSVRAFHAVRGEQGHAYEPTEKITESAFLTELLLRDMEREWRALYARYQAFEEFLSMVREDIEKVAA